MRIAAIQMNSGSIISENLTVASKYIADAARDGADLVVLPENISLMARNHSERLVAAKLEADVRTFMSKMARQHQIVLVGGSVPLLAGENKVTNTCLVYDRYGVDVGRYDKIHLFDVKLPNGETYYESKYIAAGAKPVIVDVLSTCIGVTICYDMRFPCLYRTLAQAGAEILTVPSSFTQPTGQAHWHTLLRSRAIETGCFVIAPAQCGDHEDGRKTYGHSLIISPWGEILAEADNEPEVIVADLDLSKVDEARSMVPALTHDRAFAAPEALRLAGE